jgi:hypothetical protein
VTVCELEPSGTLSKVDNVLLNLVVIIRAKESRC